MSSSHELMEMKRAVLLKRLKQQRGIRSQETLAIPTIAQESRSDLLPLSYAQERLWFITQMDSRASEAYHISGGLRLHGRLDEAALVSALDRIVQRHEMLRTRFVSVAGQAHQVIDPPSRLALMRQDIKAEELDEVGRREAGEPFDLTRGPLIRGRLLRLGESEHVLLVTMHHIVCDGWSMSVLMGELSRLYQAYRQGEPDPLPPLSLQYADYAVWQSQWLQGPLQQQQLQYWVEHLAGAPEQVSLPTDRVRPQTQDYRGESIEVSLDAGLTQALKALGQRHGTTLYMTMLAAWAAVVSRLSGQDDVVIGSPIANRHRAELEPLTGFFVNTQALRVSLSGRPSVSELLAQVRATALQAQANQDVPFEQVVEALQPVRSLAHSPIFQLMLSWLNTPRGVLNLEDLRLETLEEIPDSERFDLTLILREEGEQIVGYLSYATALFDAATVRRHWGYLRAMLHGIVRDDSQRIDRIELLSAAERRQVLESFNATARDYPREALIHELFEAQVERTPDAVAVVDGARYLSYQALNEQANRAAQALRAQGVSVGNIVGLHVARSLEQVVGVLAILKAGAAYLPLEPDYPDSRLAYMCQDSSVELIVSVKSLRERSTAWCTRVLCLDDEPALATYSASAPVIADLNAQMVAGLNAQGPADRKAEQLAYVIYTSGSTGQPKGVLVPHQGVVNYLSHAQSYLQPQHRGAVMSTPLSFDATVTTLFTPLLAGKCLVVLPSEASALFAGLSHYLFREGGDWLFKLTPAHLEALYGSYPTDEPPHAQQNGLAQQDNLVQRHCSARHCLVIGGEQLMTATLSKWVQHCLPSAVYVNEYGPTETVVGCSVYEVRGLEDLRRCGHAVAIGKPIQNTCLYVLNPEGQPVPLGAVGELCIGGDGVTRGYLNREDRTASKFREHRFGDADAQRLYHSGDLVRWRHDGQLEYLGRMDDQVKIRGYRIELGEIEAQLKQHAFVSEAAVVVQGEGSNKHLVAFVVSTSGDIDASALVDELHQALRRNLAEFMQPSVIRVLPSLPLTANGKVDRAALPKVDLGEAVDYRAPQTDTERALAEIWQRLLELPEPVSASANFFRLGGHSLLATRMALAINQRWPIELKLKDVFELQTLADLARHIELKSQSTAARDSAPGRHMLPAITPQSKSRSGETAAVTPSQRRLWLSQKLSGASSTYHVPLVARLSGSLDKQALTQSLKKIVERHEALRTNFVEQDGSVLARIHPSLSLEMHELFAIGESSEPSAVAHIVESLLARPFDLSNDPLFRADLIKVRAADHILVLCMHHIVTDGWSCDVLAKELEALYDAAAGNSAASLPDLPVSFSDYADWLALPDQQQALAAGLDYWREQLRDVPPVHSLPLDYPRPRIQSYEGGVLELTLSENLTQQMRAFAAGQGVTIYVLLQAALALLISRWSNEKDIVIGTPSSGRNYPELEHLVGFFVNPLILRNRIDLGTTVENYLSSSKRLLLAAFEHQQVGFEQIVEAVLPARSASHAPLFQIMLNYQGASAVGTSLPKISLAGLDCELLPAGRSGAKYDIEVTATDQPNAIFLQWIYASRLFGEQTIRRLLDSFEVLLAELVESPRRCLSQLRFLPQQELDFIARHSAGTPLPSPHQIFPERFAAVARRFPDAVAVQYRGEALRYAQLNVRANKLAHFLRKNGLSEGSRAAIYLDPGPELVIGLLAVLKAGGTYVPIDPAYPRERVDYILEDSGAPIVLTTQAVLQAGRFIEQRMIPVDLALQDVLCADQPEEEPETAIRDKDSSLAYILYTSGSTGKPKGVMISHCGLSNYLEYATSYFTADIHGAIVSSSICFDATITSLLTPLLLGKRVVVLESHLDAVFKGLKHYLLDDGDAWLFKITPAHLSALSYECAGHARCDARHVLVIGGEQLSHAVVEMWQSNWLPEATYINEYGPTETVVGCSVFSICGQDSRSDEKGAVSIGKPIANVGMVVINDGQLAPVGVPGELYICGPGLAEGYLNSPQLTEQRFVHLPGVAPETRFYRTGDLVRLRDDGHFEFIKRCDEQVKIRGYRIETGEIEAALCRIDGIQEAAVLVQDEGQQRLLVAFLQPQQRIDDSQAFVQQVCTDLARSLPEYMVPAIFELIEKMPLTLNGKVDKKALPKVDVQASLALSYVPPQSEWEEWLCRLWQTALGREKIGTHDNFMDIGGNSLLFVQLRADIESRLGCALDITAFFEYPTIAQLSRHLQSLAAADSAGSSNADFSFEKSSADKVESVVAKSVGSRGEREAIAVIAMAGRFPGAANPEELWSNLYQGVETLQTFSDEELMANGFSAELIANPHFVRSAAIVPGVELFDAEFFKMTPREAEALDPQQRLLLECSVEALERAGYGNSEEPLRCGVFVGCGESVYLAQHLFPNTELIGNLGLNVLHANSPNYTATRIAYKLNLNGPAVNVATACSTSLVAVHQAINSLRLGECDMAVAGGAGVSEFGASGYLYHEGGIESPDGRCRAFDQNARGTRGGNGAGIVVLKRLSDALRDTGTILAVIKGSAINNDGSQKAGYTAPSVMGQAHVIESALRDAGVSAEKIQYVETHGTGTPLGDPIEFRALSKAFATSPKQACALGTLKPNIGHLDAAAGVAALIKTVQALRHATMPPSINFERPNESISLTDSPFYFNTAPREWSVVPGERRRAGISAFGVGGTNVHVVVEEAPEPAEQVEDVSEPQGFQLIPLSARTESSLTLLVRELRNHLECHREQRLSDVAFTLQVGRKAHPVRAFFIAKDQHQLTADLADETALKIRRYGEGSARPAVVFLFPGQGTQYAGMSLGLLGVAKHYTAAFESCRELIQRHASFDVLEAIQSGESDSALLQTRITQPALFAIEYSLAVHLMGLGIRPEAMMGHSLGELVAACIAGVFDLEDAVRLVCARARHMQTSEPGAMLAISADRTNAERFYAAGTVALAAVNGPKNYVLSGDIAQIDAIEAQLNAADISCRKLKTSHAFHSPMMQAAAMGLREEMQAVSLKAPQIRFISNVSGMFITDAEACDPDYWIRHLLSPVQFARGLESLCTELGRQSRETIFVEVGVGHALANLVRRNPCAASNTVVSLVRHFQEQGDDQIHLLQGLGSLWAAGCDLNWRLLQQERKPRRIQLPTYPFERKRYWVERVAASAKQRHGTISTSIHQATRPEDWFYLPVWRLAPGSGFLPAETNTGSASWLLLSDRLGIAEKLAACVPADQETVVLPPSVSDASFDGWIGRFAQRSSLSIVCLWAIDPPPDAEDDRSYESFQQAQHRSFYPLLKLLQTLLAQYPQLQIRLHVITDRVLRVTGDEAIQASLATLRSLCKVMPQENPQMSCQLVDIDTAWAGTESGRLRLARQLWQEFNNGENVPEVARRGNGRWLKFYEPLNGSGLCKARQRLVRHGHYLITGGLGRIGLQLAMFLAKDYLARITLVSRREFPAQLNWERLDEGALPAEVVDQMRWLSKIKALGSDIQVIRADVSHAEELEQALSCAEQAFGAINGVIHAAGNVQNSVTPIQHTDKEICDQQFSSKVAGLINLERALQTRTVDFCLVMSSLAVELGGLGFTAYAAANSYADAFVQRMRNAGQDYWCSINWDGWNFSSQDRALFGMEHTMGPEEGVSAFSVATCHLEHPCLVNSTSDLNARFEKWIRMPAQESSAESVYGRPDISEEYRAPATRTQEALSCVWQDVLGIEQIGINDNFFELGGDSLVATRLVAKIRAHFAVSDAVFSLADFFSSPVICDIAEKLDGASVIGELQAKQRELRREAVIEEGEF